MKEKLKIIRIYSIIFSLTWIIFALVACSHPTTPQQAQEKLQKLKISFDEQTFINCIKDKKNNIIELFLLAGMNPNAKDHYDATALMYAVQVGDLHIVNLLLNSGADVNTKNADGETVSTWATNHYHQINSLYIKKVRGQRTDQTANINKGLLINYSQIIYQLLESNTNPNADPNLREIKDGTTPLILIADIGDVDIAEKNGHVEIVKLLLDHGAEVDVKDNDNGMTPLIYASLRGDESVVKLLLENGANINIKDNTGNTALMRTASSSAFRHIYVAELLLKNGADITGKDNGGNTALDIALRMQVHSQNTEMVQLLYAAAKVQH